MTLSRIFILLVAVLALRAAEPATKRYLYMSTPDGAQEEGRSGEGILVFDIDAAHRFVRRISIPSFKEGLRGFTPSLANHCAYYSTTSRRLGCVDLETDKVVWEKVLPAGCDRSSVSADGKKDVYYARTKKRVTLLTDENAHLFASSKFFEAQFRDGKLVQVGNEFGLGRANALSIAKLSVNRSWFAQKEPLNDLGQRR